MAGEFCFATVGLAIPTEPDPVHASDVNAMADRFISITPMDANMTARFFGILSTIRQLGGLEP
jgi:hypothetical protein